MGQRFAYMQIKLVLIKLLTTFELDMVDDFPEPNYSSIVVGPKGDTKIRCENPPTPHFTHTHTHLPKRTDTHTVRGCHTRRQVDHSYTGAPIPLRPARARKKKMTKTKQTTNTHRYRRRHPEPERAFSETFTKEEVARHNSVTDCWIIVDGKVLDVTPFLDQHPGGVEELLQWGGREATDAVLKNISHPDTIEGTIEQFVIGRVA